MAGIRLAALACGVLVLCGLLMLRTPQRPVGRQDGPLPGSAPAARMVRRRLVVPAASAVTLSHVGVRTHANRVVFGDPPPRLLAARTAPGGVRLIGHCRLPTDRSALPLRLGRLGTWLAGGYGPAEGHPGVPGWGVVWRRPRGRWCPVLLVPSRFANWLAQQPPDVRRRYDDSRAWWLECFWDERAPEKTAPSTDRTSSKNRRALSHHAPPASPSR